MAHPGRGHEIKWEIFDKMKVVIILFLSAAGVWASAQSTNQLAPQATHSPYVLPPPTSGQGFDLSSIPRPVIPPSMAFPMVTNLAGTNRHDVYGTWLSNTIEACKQALASTNLDAAHRQLMEQMLRFQQGQLSAHQEQMQKQAEFVKAARANPRTAWTNLPDPIEAALSSDINTYEALLTDPGLAPAMRKSYEAMLANYRSKLADYHTTAQLRANLRLAEQSQNPEQIAKAKSQLADYLASRQRDLQGGTNRGVAH